MAFTDELGGVAWATGSVLRGNSAGEHRSRGEFGCVAGGRRSVSVRADRDARGGRIAGAMPAGRSAGCATRCSAIPACLPSDFSVDVLNRNIRVPVRSDQTLLDALIEAGVDMIYDCQRGECGLCAVKVVEREGEIDHRDVFLNKDEKAEMAGFAPVSRVSRTGMR